MVKKQDFSKKIIKRLAEKPAFALTELEERIKDNNGQKPKYALKRTLKNLKNTGLIDNIFSGKKEYIHLTKAGKKKANLLKLENKNALLNLSWDGFWRIILLDLPEDRKPEREALRYLLKKAGFIALKNSVWVSPYPFEHLFANIKKDLGLTTELMIIVTKFVDEETKQNLFSQFQI